MNGAEPAARERRGILQRLGLHRPELRAWAMYDWAASAFQTTIMVAVFPIYFIRVAGAGGPEVVASQWWGYANSAAIAIVALLSPVLGAIADFSASKKRFLGSFAGLGVAAVAGMYFIQRGDLVLAAFLYLVASVAAAGSFVFYESLLPHIAREDEVDQVSTSGYAFGYVGGGILLALNLAWIQKPELFGIPAGTLPARLSFLSVAVWWAVFSIPLLRRVPEPPRLIEADESPARGAVRAAFSRLAETFHELRGYKNAFLLLLAFLLYNDGIATIQKMAVPYGTELGIPEAVLIGSILLVQFVGIPFAFLFGMLAGRIGAKRSILLGLVVYVAISLVGFNMRTGRDFLVLALMVGMVQGGTQALSRSLFATMIPRHKSGEFFGFFSVFSKFAGIFGPLLFAAVIGQTGSSRYGILSVIAFFVSGALLLMLVDPAEGERAAREAEAAVRVVDDSETAVAG
ncbi:MAG TPA: MFS transporter [Longimicrobiaceae bacterium]|nr:MFS transporter [Longimicrobiaceae bacterium]